MIRSACLMLMTLFALSATAQNDTASRIARVEQGLLPRVVLDTALSPQMKLEDRMVHHGVPGVSVAVIDGGKVAWVRHYGFADLQRDRKVTAQTRFQVGELSTLVTAVAALELVERGQLSLDEDVHRWLRRWRIPSTPALEGHKVTVRRLLSHAAGFQVPYYDGYDRRGAVPTLLQVLEGAPPAMGRPHQVERTPGIPSRFSAGGYSVLQQVMTDATGARFEALLQQRVLGPLRMGRSGFQQPPPAKLAAQLATGYRNEAPVEGGYRLYPEQAAFGLWSTAEDLAQLVLELQRARAGKGKVLDQASARELLLPGFGGMGLGARVTGAGDAQRFTQLGQAAGFDAALVGFVSRGQGAVVLTNREGGLGLADELLLAIAAEYRWPDFAPRTAKAVPAEVLDALAGSYRLLPLKVGERTLAETTARAFVRGEQLFWQPEGMEARPLWSSGKDDFFALDDAPGVSFVRDPKGRVTGVRVHGNGLVRHGRRLEPSAAGQP